MRGERGDRYRWLEVGQRVRYVGREGTEHRGKVGEVAYVPRYAPAKGPKNVVVRLEGGGALIAPAGCWRGA